MLFYELSEYFEQTVVYVFYMVPDKEIAGKFISEHPVVSRFYPLIRIFKGEINDARFFDIKSPHRFSGAHMESDSCREE